MESGEQGHYIGLDNDVLCVTIQILFLLFHLLIRVAFELDASCSFINASCVIGLSLEVEAFREMMRNSSLGSRVRVG